MYKVDTMAEPVSAAMAEGELPGPFTPRAAPPCPLLACAAIVVLAWKSKLLCTSVVGP